ncbi:ABC transporter ATP-binding protein [Telmatospirillum sp. J64-1]|uniref:ABC transporter ATP-binding protein n=1 Tax=Telmatospirillum sp. J64-1 TaxID=2502183 RepID=UPI00115E3B22|nr:ABC transporter ATP-binding protein [Telmatospirillum sp. J64-1]
MNHSPSLAGKGISVAGINKYFAGSPALQQVTLDIAQGEFVALLGPSGCGKTTLLRILAGLAAPETGRVLFGGQTMVDMANRHLVPAEKRNIGMVFQDYALWPHMRVRENVAFPLKARGVPRSQHAELVQAALDKVSLGTLGERFPNQLSGGQQQRVALARAIVAQPPIILFDEPLSNLDAGLRDTLGRDLAALVRELGITAVYVTHDQAEALSLADRIAVMRAGRIIQCDRPETLFHDPVDPWVAGFLKTGSLIEGRLDAGYFVPASGGPAVEFADTSLTGAVTLMVPGAAVRSSSNEADLPVTVQDIHFRGDRYEISARWGQSSQAPVLQFWHDRPAARGDILPVALDRHRLRLFPAAAA